MTVDTLTIEQRQTLESLLTPDLIGRLEHTCNWLCYGTFDPGDLLAMTLLRMARSIDTWKGHGSFQSWSMVVLYSTFKTELRRRQGPQSGINEQTLPLPKSYAEDWDKGVASNYRLEDHALEDDLSPELQAAMSSLSNKQRTALLMHAYGYSHKEIAQALGCTVGSSCSLVRKARHKALRNYREAGQVA